MYFFVNSSNLPDVTGLLSVMKNVITNRFFQFIDERLLVSVCKFALGFSYTLAKTTIQARDILKQKQQRVVVECHLVVELVGLLIEQLMNKECISYVVLCLCEILDILTICVKQQPPQNLLASIDSIIALIYGVC